jgi:hypothetical protein
MSGIRVTYAGLISFIVGISSVLTGTIFTLIVTRRLTPDEFGTWNLIGSLILYVMISEPIISYWVTRETARGMDSGKSAVISSGMFSAAGIFVYLIIAYFVGLQTNAHKDILIFAVILVPVMFLNRTLTAINLGWKPQSTSYGILAFESAKIPCGLIFVALLHMGVFGAIVSTTLAYLGSIFILIIYAKDKIKNKFKIQVLKKWLKYSWLPLYPGIGTLIFSLDVLIFSLITRSFIGLAFYSSALAVSSLVSHSGLISQAIYPKLLGGGKKDHLQENLIRFFYFGIPLTALSITFARPALFALNPFYEIAVPTAIFMTIRGFVYALAGIFDQSLQGIEDVDTNEESKFKDFVKSKLFFLPTLRLSKFILYIATLSVMLFLLQSRNVSQSDLVIYWSIILLITEIPFAIYLYILTRKSFELRIPSSIIIKYLLICIGVFGFTYLLIERYLEYKNNIFIFFPNVLLYIGIAMGSYLLITYFVDLRTRKLFNAIINEIRNKS